MTVCVCVSFSFFFCRSWLVFFSPFVVVGRLENYTPWTHTQTKKSQTSQGKRPRTLEGWSEKKTTTQQQHRASCRYARLSAGLLSTIGSGFQRWNHPSMERIGFFRNAAPTATPSSAPRWFRFPVPATSHPLTPALLFCFVFFLSPFQLRIRKQTNTRLVLSKRRHRQWMWGQNVTGCLFVIELFRVQRSIHRKTTIRHWLDTDFFFIVSGKSEMERANENGEIFWRPHWFRNN